MDEQVIALFREMYGDPVAQAFAERGKELRIAARVEDSFQADDSVRELLTSAFARAAGAQFKVAAENPAGMIREGRPRMMKITAWLCHADVINVNRYFFTHADLQAAVEKGLFAPPYVGMMDYNHDFNLYGIFYQTRFEFDEVAQKWGVLAEGVLFAWRFSELADRMLAMQSRQGHIDVSVACLPEFVQVEEDAEGQDYLVLREPTFFGCSVLDVPPADLDARGVASEDPDQPREERELLLTLSQLDTDLTASIHHALEEPNMDIEKLVEEIRKAFSEETQEQLKPLFEAAARLPGIESELETARGRVSELETELADVRTQAEEQRLAADAARTTVTEQETELAELRQFRADLEAREAEAAEAAQLETRLAQLNKSAKAALEKMDDEVQARLKARWAKMDEDEWKVARAALNGSENENEDVYTAASRKEGLLPVTGEEQKPRKYAIDEYVKL